MMISSMMMCLCAKLCVRGLERGRELSVGEVVRSVVSTIAVVPMLCLSCVPRREGVGTKKRRHCNPR